MVAATSNRRSREASSSTSHHASSDHASKQASNNHSAQPAAPSRIESEMKPQRDGEFNLMLRGLLHELRNPLSSILTAANLVEDSARDLDDNEETAMLLGVIKKESLRLNRILTEFANYIKLPEPRPTAFDIVQLTRDTVAQLQDDKVLGKDVRVTDDLPAECFVWADQNQIRTALHHLLRNSGEAMPESGTLQLSLQDDGENAVICLSDSGAGLSEENRERAFQPFYSTKVHGIGLGLSAARAIIEAAGGRVWIDSGDVSTPEASTTSGAAGACLCVELPRTEPSENADDHEGNEYS